jgi:hypothetical protein
LQPVQDGGFEGGFGGFWHEFNNLRNISTFSY